MMSLLRHTHGTREDTEISSQEFLNDPIMTQNDRGQYRWNYGCYILQLAHKSVHYTLLHI